MRLFRSIEQALTHCGDHVRAHVDEILREY